MVQCFMGGDYCSTLSTAEVTSPVLHHALVTTLQKLDWICKEIYQKVENMTSVEGLRGVGLLSLKKEN